MLYKSTRGNAKTITSSEAIVKGIAEDGGLYVPLEFPEIDRPFEELCKLDYKELAFYIMRKYFDDFNEEELKECIEKAYDEKFENPLIAPLNFKNGVWFLELFHGKTLAFKDIALSVLPHLLTAAARKTGISKDIVILTATSGDTGKAAMEGFDSVDGTKIIVFYPKDGVSEIQKLQMTTQEGSNTLAVGIDGNFDDAQSGVKEIFADKDFNKLLDEKGFILSSANSINIGRLVPQIVYYVYSYLNLLKENKINVGESIDIAVPTGNFGNILAAYYAGKMGIPIGKLICASNENNVLADFINTGIYDRRREFILTNSPSMDILISSNLERFLYELSGRDPGLIRELMGKLIKDGYYEINEKMKEEMHNILYGDFSTQADTLKAIKEVYDESGYLIDTHTAVAWNVYQKYRKSSGDERNAIVVSTASPFKFPGSINEALNFTDGNLPELTIALQIAEKTGMSLPKSILDLAKKPVRHKKTCRKDQMKEIVKEFLNI